MWYFSMMSSVSPPVREPDIAAMSRPRTGKTHPRPLSEIHARALYRPVPPVDLDDDGYPYSDSLPVESTNHERARTHLVEVVRARFADRPDVYPASDLGLYFERGNRRALVVPDALVAFAVDAHPDHSYKLWEHRRVPDFVMEVLSRRTWRKDVYDKPGLYADLGVGEYWLFDPYGTRRDGGAVLEGRKLVAGRGWEPVAACPAGDGLVSEVLGLDLLVVAGELRFRDRDTGGIVPNLAESIELNKQSKRRADGEAARADREAARAEAAERRLAEAVALLREKDNG